MADFTDTADAVNNTGFSDSTGTTDTQLPQESINNIDASADTGTSSPVTSADTAQAEVTPFPEDPTQGSSGDGVTNTAEEQTQEQDIYTLLQQLQTEQQEYQTQVLETAQTLTEQAKNTLSCLVLTIVLIGFLSGLVLARSVWRKL